MTPRPRPHRPDLPRGARWVGVGAALLLSSVARADDRAALDARIAEAARALLPAVAELRRLDPRFEVAVLVEEPGELRRRVLEDSLDERARADLLVLGKTLRAFGLLDGGFDLETNVQDVLSDQIGGYYDPSELRLVLVRRDDVFTSGALEPGSEDAMVAAHELVHALQDQHFDLWHLHNRDFHSDDVATAVLSLVEGDASWAMMLLSAGTAADVLRASDHAQFVREFVVAGEETTYDGPLAQMPRVLRDGLIFPYLYGAAFVREVERARGWEGVNALFAQPPLSSEHVLHPEKYLAGDDPPLRIDLPDLAGHLGAGWSRVTVDVMGEAAIRSLLAQLSGHPAARFDRAAAGWEGDAFEVLEHADGRLAVAWTTRWESPRDAREAATAMRRLGRGWTVVHQGSRVDVLVGVPEPARRDVLRALAAAPASPVRSLDEVSVPRDEPRKVTFPPVPPPR